ncbi:glycosyltransferase family 4 protein [Patescibacteria group bacterium]
MKVLMLSLDSSILDNNSVSASRMRDYGSICDELHIVVLGKGGKKLELSENVFIYPTEKNRLSALLKTKNIGKKILSENNNWIITCQDPFEVGFIGWQLSKKFKCGLEVQLHGDFYSNQYWRKERLLNRFRWYLGKFILKRANLVRVVSERIKKSIEGFTKAKIFENPILSELKNFEIEKKEDGIFTILNVGNLVPVKNHEQLIEVFAEIKKELPNTKLIIAGDGPRKKELQATSYKLQANIIFVGHKEDLANLYKSADILVHISLYEGWGRVLIEAASYELPIIMTDVGLAGEVIKNEESGLVVPVNDKKALKDAILRLAKDKDLQKKLAQGAKKEVEKITQTKQEYLEKIKESWQNALDQN